MYHYLINSLPNLTNTSGTVNIKLPISPIVIPKISIKVGSFSILIDWVTNSIMWLMFAIAVTDPIGPQARALMKLMIAIVLIMPPKNPTVNK